MGEIMRGEATPAQIAAFITALRCKGETVEEITGCARAMRAEASTISLDQEIVLDTCGTGGDGASTFNISTATALVAAGAGVTVAKHGNRAVSSKCGSADVLEGLGVKIDLPPDAVKECIEEVGIGFLFAPVFHQAMKHAVGPRRDIGIRTVFNILGPLTNPAGANAQVMGVYSPELTQVMAHVLDNLGSKRSIVVHGKDGSDELSIAGQTQVSELQPRGVTNYEVSPEDLGLPRYDMSEIVGGSVEENVRILLEVLQGKEGAARDAVILNGAAAMVVASKCSILREGAEIAREAIDSGSAMQKLDALRGFTARFA
jgi:anthranilate phosphoribosyltransferase